MHLPSSTVLGRGSGRRPRRAAHEHTARSVATVLCLARSRCERGGVAGTERYEEVRESMPLGP